MRRRSFTIFTETRKAWHSIFQSTLLMMIIGVLYVLAFVEIHPHTVANGLIIGFIIGFVGSTVETFVFTRRRQRFTFSVLLALRTLFYLVLVCSTVFWVAVYHASLMASMTVTETIATPKVEKFLYEGEFLQIVVFALGVSFLVNFIRQVNRLLGHNALLMFITGKYHQPVEEERIFMFLDLKSSTSIAEKLGNIKYHEFLNEFFHDISPAIVESKGTIYQYVGDEVVVTWTKARGLRDANCIACYFRIAAAIHLKSDKYESQFGFLPEFKAGYHYGPVITGEIGDVKREIVYHGDTVNTAARIRSECTTFKKDLLLSGELLRRLAISEYLSPESIGRIRLRGKEEEVELFSILEAA
ncbi:MAG: adenylate/guanylate cyclase domain-containing protein [Ignavibacteriae bacterium]|nr:adenylate/guanylate cyclase domain-containing protein [Ignavibacteriota bacterium]